MDSDTEMIDTSTGKEQYQDKLMETDIPQISQEEMAMLKQLNDSPITQDDAWVVIQAYFKQHGLVKQQISSFDRFLTHQVLEIITENGEVQIEQLPQYIHSKY